ncbi:MAG TPA: site-specific integrase [Thermoguttaceae bacterium]|nr:site-specific integrase [Thermoguttaceae bacterium]
MGNETPWNRGRKLPPEVLTPGEVKVLMGACSTRAPTGIRNRALITVLYRGLLRIEEALALKPKDLDREPGTIRVLHGKGDKSRTVGLDDGAWAVLEVWLERRTALGMNGKHPLFCNLKGKRLLPSYCRALFPRLAAKAGIDKRVHPHALRHTGASEMRTEGIDVGVISKQLGHSSIATTSRYLDHIAPAVVVEAVRRRKWEA